ncbi:lytic polysaccharide monooxygenase [Pleomassaria siparia CBS 279.74]|uniref:Lytic polysaccharide monooxygenase n=1 Tax=Pleomassaria siparia CBS 279.74 TaxID=1314801 RepID=A0A6G1JZ31_9PLEO|nr:lytic polysaccharide monooxygenase [Pleomassaria siparia CBS 279.74]
MFFTPAIAAMILAYTSGVSAHLIMSNPVMFSGTTQAPMDMDTGADFPCGAHEGVATMNNWTAGETQQIKIVGGATHSGGSCQFSFTTDAVPTVNSKWKVIHSIIGGCPNDIPGNMSGNAEDQSIPAIPVTIPKDVPNGQLTFAWTWFNKTGNREMYMKCAPVTMSGGADNADALNALPDIFVANVPHSKCETLSDVNVVFPNPGASVVKGSTTDLGAPGFKGPECQAAGASTPTTTPTDGTTTPAPANPAPVASAPAAPAPVASAPVASAPVAPAPVSNGSTCTTDGALVCISATQFGICSGGTAVPQAVAAGTTCVNGAIQRRAVHHPRRHAGSLVRRHASAFRA